MLTLNEDVLRLIIADPDLTKSDLSALCLPRLANYIRTVKYMRTMEEIERFPRSCRRLFEFPESPLPEAIAFVERAAAELPYRDDWLERIQWRDVEGYLAILFTQLPRVRALHLGHDLFIEHKILGRVVRSLLTGTSVLPGALPGSLSCLQIVEINKRNRRYDPFTSTAADLLPFFHISSLEAATLDIEPPAEGALSPLLPPPCRYLTRLTLGAMRESHLGQVLSLAPRLRSFHWMWYHLGTSNPHPHNTSIIDLGLILSALGQVKSTLTELNIHAVLTYDWDEWGTGSHDPLRFKGSARGLATFRQLKKPTIPLAFLTGFDESAVDDKALIKCLPPNLECLTLLDDLYRDAGAGRYFWDNKRLFSHTIVAWLNHLLGEESASKPSLKRLCLGFYKPEESDEELTPGLELPSIRRSIQELCRQMGIEFSVPARVWFPSTGWD